MGIFGTTKGSVKKRVAQRYGGAQLKTQPGHTVVVSRLKDWEIIFDIDSPFGPPVLFFGPPPATRVGIPFAARDDFTWEIRRRRFVGDAIYERRHKQFAEGRGHTWEQAFSEIQRGLGEPKVPLGYGDFDYEFTIETSDEARMREFLDDADFRRALQTWRGADLRVVRQDEWLDSLVDKLPDGTSALYFETSVTLKDEAKIDAIYRIIPQAIWRLAEIGSAAPLRPGLFSRPLA